VFNQALVLARSKTLFTQRD